MKYPQAVRVCLALCVVMLIFGFFFFDARHVKWLYGGTSGPCYEIGTLVSRQERLDIQKCEKNFDDILETVIDRSQMESDRWTKHGYLRETSRVVEVGGYTGVDASKFIKQANPNYIALEPVPMYYTILENKFKDNTKFKLFKFGLGRGNRTLKVNVAIGDAISLFKTKASGGQYQQLFIRDAKEFFNSIGVVRTPVDLLMINCEGCEYELLEFIIAEQFAKYMRNIQVQFHVALPGVEAVPCRYCQIMKLLARTHAPVFQYSYTWQMWTLK